MTEPYFRLSEQGLPEPIDPSAPLPPMPEGLAELRTLAQSPDAAFSVQERDGETVILIGPGSPMEQLRAMAAEVPQIRPVPRIIDDPPPPLMSQSAANRHARRKAAVLARWARR